MKGERSPWEGENEEKGQHMQEKENAGWNTSEEDALGLWLRKAVREGAYTEEYCTKLEAYEKVTKNEAAVLYFAARLAFALGEMEEAHRLAHEAYARRKLSHKVWQLLFEIGDALGLDEEAVFFKSLCQQNMALDAPMPLFSDTRLQDAFFRGMLNVQAAPFRFNFAERAEGGMELNFAPALGQFLLSEAEDASLDRYYCAAYNEWDFFHTQARRVDFMKRGGARTLNDYCGMFFDVMKARRMEGSIEVGAQCILPIAPTVEGQTFELASAEAQGGILCGREEFRFLRLDGRTKISSKEPFVVGAPIPLGHSPRRKKLVLSLLLDGLSWQAMKARGFQPVPNLMRFFSDGVIFNNNYCAAEYTFVSLGTIETGMLPHRSQVVWDKPMFKIDKGVKTLSEQMKSLGYYCVNVMGDGRGIYDGVTRGFDRLVVHPYLAQPTYEGVARTIAHLEAFDECDNYVFLHVEDAHSTPATIAPLALKTQTHIPWRHTSAPSSAAAEVSVHLPYNDAYLYDNPHRIETMDRELGRLFDYIETHYAPDEYIVCAYSDHGSSVYSEDAWYFSETQGGAALMLRGAGVPHLGTVEELSSCLDIYPMLAKLVGFAAPAGQLDGVLPRALGGAGRRYCISNSIYPEQTYKLSIRTQEHEFRLETARPTHHDGTVDMSRFASHIYTRDAAHKEVFDAALHAEFLRIAHEHTASFHEKWEE